MKGKGFFEHRRYLGYLMQRLLGGELIRFYRRVLKWVRPTLWLRRILRVLLSLALLLESGALLLLLSAAALLLLPPTAAMLFVLLPAMLRTRARVSVRLLPRLKGKRVVLLRGDGGEPARRLSLDGYFVLQIPLAPSLFQPYRERAGELCELSPWLYFFLRRRIAERAARVVCIEKFENTLAAGRSRML